MLTPHPAAHALHSAPPPHPTAALMQGVANRDIKLENTLLDHNAPPLLKLCDFGYSKVTATHFRSPLPAPGVTSAQQRACRCCCCWCGAPWTCLPKPCLRAALLRVRRTTRRGRRRARWWVRPPTWRQKSFAASAAPRTTGRPPTCGPRASCSTSCWWAGTPLSGRGTTPTGRRSGKCTR